MAEIKEVVENAKDFFGDNGFIVLLAGGAVLFLVSYLKGGSTSATLTTSGGYSGYPSVETNANVVIDTIQKSLEYSEDNIKSANAEQAGFTNALITAGTGALSDKIDSTKDTLTDKISTSKDEILDRIDSTGNKISDQIDNTQNQISSTQDQIGGLWDSMRNLFGDMGTTIAGNQQDLLDYINKNFSETNGYIQSGLDGQRDLWRMDMSTLNENLMNLASHDELAFRIISSQVTGNTAGGEGSFTSDMRTL